MMSIPLNAYRGDTPLQDTRSLLQSGRVNFVLTIPSGFSKSLGKR